MSDLIEALQASIVAAQEKHRATETVCPRCVNTGRGFEMVGGTPVYAVSCPRCGRRHSRIEVTYV